MDGNGHDRKVCPWQGRVLTEASLRNLERLEENGQYSSELSVVDREVLDTANSLGESAS